MVDTSSYKQLSLDAVKIIMEYFLLDKGEVTTLQVKNYFKNRGYWATQDDISAFMSQAAASPDLFGGVYTYDIDGKFCNISYKYETKNNRSFKVYFFEEQVDTPVVD